MIEQLRHQRAAGSDEVISPVQRVTVNDVLSSSGRPLPATLEDEMEARLDADFSDVRLHTGAAAQRSASEIGANAYTSGSHVVIGNGGNDKHTLAHELTHVIQQRTGPVSGTDQGDGLAISAPSDRFEQAAEHNARTAMSKNWPMQKTPDDEQASRPAAPGTAIQRMPNRPAGTDQLTPATRQAWNEQKRQAPGDAFVRTLHHIVPRGKLIQFAGMLSPAQQQTTAMALAPFAPTAFQPNPRADRFTSLLGQALSNLPANLLVGPSPQDRNDDPGRSREADLNATDDGSITPRSEQLEAVYEFISAKTTTPNATVSDQELMAEFITPLQRASYLHQYIAGGGTAFNPGVGLDPDRARWSGDPAAHTARHPKPLEPLI
jgi:hypothetical protein